jgi:thiosulfate sulfurtransferase
MHTPSAVTALELAQLQSSGAAFTLLDVRRDIARANNGTEIAGGQWCNPALWLEWKDQVPADKPVVLYCAHGHEIGQGLTTVLRVMGLDARYLDGGMTAWQGAGLPTAAVL